MGITCRSNSLREAKQPVKMFSRYFLMLCTFALFAGAIVSAVDKNEVPAEQNSGEVESRDSVSSDALL